MAKAQIEEQDIRVLCSDLEVGDRTVWRELGAGRVIRTVEELRPMSWGYHIVYAERDVPIKRWRRVAYHVQHEHYAKWTDVFTVCIRRRLLLEPHA